MPLLIILKKSRSFKNLLLQAVYNPRAFIYIFDNTLVIRIMTYYCGTLSTKILKRKEEKKGINRGDYSWSTSK